MKSKLSIGLYWFRHDLRLTDNRTFNKLCSEVDRLICVYVKGQEKEFRSSFSEGETGRFKHKFEQESAVELDIALRKKKQYLLFVDAPAHQSIVDLIENYSITHMGVEEHPGIYETKSLDAIQASCPHVQYITDISHNLFNESDLPFELGNLPETFTPFRKRVENNSIDPPIAALLELPHAIEPMPQAPEELSFSGRVRGGEVAGNEQLNKYLFGTE